MECPDQWLYEYSVIRFVPRIDREEFINIGLIMMCKRRKWMMSRIHIDENRLKFFFPNIDINCIRQQATLFEKKDVPASDLPVEEKYRWLTATKSAILQTSPSHPGIIMPRKPDEYSESNLYLREPASKSRKVSFEDIHEKQMDQFILENEFNRLFTNLVL